MRTWIHWLSRTFILQSTMRSQSIMFTLVLVSDTSRRLLSPIAQPYERPMSKSSQNTFLTSIPSVARATIADSNLAMEVGMCSKNLTCNFANMICLYGPCHVVWTLSSLLSIVFSLSVKSIGLNQVLSHFLLYDRKQQGHSTKVASSAKFSGTMLAFVLYLSTPCPALLELFLLV